MNATPPAARNPALFGCVVALCASLWALLDQGACGACEAVTLLSGSPVLPILGTLWYAALFVLLLRRGLVPLSAALLYIGAGVHLALVCYMLLRGELCAPCMSAASGAFLMAGAALHARVLSPRRSYGLLALAALLSALGLAAVTTQSEYKLQRELQRALATVRESAPPAADEAELVWFSREDCERCATFRADILPVLQGEYGPRLRVSEREAGRGIPAPTVVIRGRRETILYPNPSLDSLRGVINEEVISDQ